MNEILPNQAFTTSTTDSSPNDEELFRFTRGPRQADVIFIGEAWGDEEAACSLPFIGSSGKELDRILHDAGLSNARILYTNVAHYRLPFKSGGYDFTQLMYPNKEKDAETWNGAKVNAQLREYISLLLRLINRVRPKLLIAAGNWPLFILTEHAELKTTDGFKLPTGIAKWRGSQTYSRLLQDGKRLPVLPIIHPAAILREWGWRQITVHDLRTRAGRFLKGERTWDENPKHKRTHKPTWADIQSFTRNTYSQLEHGPTWISVDLETFKRKWISVVGLATEKEDLVVPLFLRGTDDKLQNYFPLWQEQTFFRDLKTILEHPNARIIGQNFIYDTEWLWRYYNIKALCAFDTMVAHHLLFPGTPKRLDYLASLYCDHFIYWKDESRDWDQLPEDAERYWLYNAKDIRATYEVGIVLRAAIEKSGLSPLLEERMEQWILSREMSLRGSLFNSSLQKEMKLELLEEASSLQQWLLAAIPESARFASSGKPWYDSPTQTALILYTILGIRPVLHKKTKRPTTDDAALAEISERAECAWLQPLLQRLRHLRSIGVFTKNFLSAKVSPDGRMRSTFNVAHPETFRWSSNSNGFGEGMNLQNIPKGDKDYVSSEDETENGMDLGEEESA